MFQQVEKEADPRKMKQKRNFISDIKLMENDMEMFNNIDNYIRVNVLELLCISTYTIYNDITNTPSLTSL